MKRKNESSTLRQVLQRLRILQGVSTVNSRRNQRNEATKMELKTLKHKMRSENESSTLHQVLQRLLDAIKGPPSQVTATPEYCKKSSSSSSSLLLSCQEMSDTIVYEPWIRALEGATTFISLSFQKSIAPILALENDTAGVSRS